MRFSEAWLREWVNPPVETQQLADQLSMAGLEVDAVEPAAPVFEGVRIGLVQAVEPHPDAAKLRVCTVDLGEDEPLRIVCGAANVAAGMRVPVATVGARLPGDLRIKRARLRGVESQGMICSASELGLAESSEGILPLDADAPIGADFRAWMALDDCCIEVDLTPDRGDCLGLAGLAREVAAINRLPFAPPAIHPVTPLHDERVLVRLDAPAACPRYACRIVRNLDPRAVTPLWMRERLRRSGLRAIHPVVDVTNYAMLELGQPMHAFDLARVAGGEIRVRLAADGETLELLNGETLTLRPDNLVIADASRPLALAGIMGGAASGVGPETRDILFESAFFAPAAISGKARAHGLHTDSSHRFERGVDPELQVRALERATRLLLDIAGGEPGPTVDMAVPDHPPKRRALHLRETRIERILGLTLPAPQVTELLERLGMVVERLHDGWWVTPPSARFDLLHEVDLIADLGRIHGYDRIPVTSAGAATAVRTLPETAFDLDRARLALVDRGFHEVITYSFVSPELQALADPGLEPLRLANPISADLSVMRTSLWPGLFQAARHNRARQQERVRIFESGLRFRPGPAGLAQTPGLGGLVMGPCEPEQWGAPTRPVDFYDLKGDVEALLALTGAAGSFRFVAAEHPALHPGQSARIEREGAAVGWLGRLHPALTDRLDLDDATLVFELELEPLNAGLLPAYAPISRFPGVRRDLALLLDDGIPFEAVADCVRSAAPDWLREIVPFDVYTGETLGAGRKSIAFGLIFQVYSQTLTEPAIEDAMARILDRLTSELGARLRD